MSCTCTGDFDKPEKLRFGGNTEHHTTGEKTVGIKRGNGFLKIRFGFGQ